jgi:hypothetical protein
MRTTGISIFIIISHILLISCTKQNIGNDLAELNLAGKIRILKEARYGATEKSGHIQKKELNLKHVVMFNNKGNITEENYFFSNGELFYRMAFNYDKKDNCIEKITSGNLQGRSINTYDKNDNKIQTNFYDNQGAFMSKVIYKWDENGNNIEQILHDSLSTRRSVLHYNNKHKVVEVINYNPDGRLTDKYSYRYNRKGNLIESTRFSADGNLNSKSELRYDKSDKHGNWLMRMEYTNDILYGLTEREMEYY